MSNNIYDILKKLENLKAPKKILSEGKKSKPDYIDIDNDGDKTEPMKKAVKDKTKSGMAKAVAQVEQQLAEKYRGFKKRLGEESDMIRKVIPVKDLDQAKDYEHAQEIIKNIPSRSVKRQELPGKELPPIEDRSRPAEKPKAKAVDESGLRYHTGVKKHGKKYMELAKKAGQKGASQEELGRLKDKHSKAYKNKKMDEGILGLAGKAVAPGYGAADTVTRAKDDDPVGAGMSAAATAFGGLGMIPSPASPFALGASFGLDALNLLRDVAREKGGWKQLGQDVMKSSGEFEHMNLLPEDFEELDELDRSGQLEEGVLSKLFTKWGPEGIEWLTKKFSKDRSDDLASAIARSDDAAAAAATKPKVNYDIPPSIRKEMERKEREAARLSGSGSEKKPYSGSAVDLEKEFAKRDADRLAAVEREAAERAARAERAAAERAEQVAAEKAAADTPSVFTPDPPKPPGIMKKIGKGVAKAVAYPAGVFTAGDLARHKYFDTDSPTWGTATGRTVQDILKLGTGAATSAPEFVSDIFKGAVKDQPLPKPLPEPNRPYDPSKPSGTPSRPPTKKKDDFNTQGLRSTDSEQGVAEGRYIASTGQSHRDLESFMSGDDRHEKQPRTRDQLQPDRELDPTDTTTWRGPKKHIQHRRATGGIRGPRGPLPEGEYNEDMLSPGQKKIAKIRARHDKMDEADDESISPKSLVQKMSDNDPISQMRRGEAVKPGEYKSPKLLQLPDPKSLLQKMTDNPISQMRRGEAVKPGKMDEDAYNEDMLSPKQKKIASMAGDPDKIDAKDFAALRGKKTGKKTEGNKFSGNLMRARAQGLKQADLDGDGDMEKVTPGKTNMREGWEEMQRYLEKKRGPEAKGGAGKKAGSRYGGSAQRDDDEDTDGEGQLTVKKKGRPKGTGGGAKFSFKLPKDKK